MSHEGGPEPTQRTVAELLAKYGQESGGNAPRRRRRRADDVEDTGAQAIIERVMSESGEMPVIRDDTPSPTRTSHRANRTDFQRPVEPPPRRRQPPPPPSAGPPTVATPPVTGPPSSSRLPVVGPPSSSRLPVVGPPADLPRRDRQAPPPATRRGQEPPPRRQQPSQQLPQPSQQLPAPPRQQPSQQLRKPPPGQPPGQRTGVGPSLRSRLDGDPPPTQTMPPASSAKAPPPPEPMTEELPRVPTYPSMEPADQRHPGQDSRTQLTPPVYPPQRDQFQSGPQPRVPDRDSRDFDPDDDYAGGDYGTGYRTDYDSGYQSGVDKPFDTGFNQGFDPGDRVEDGDRAYGDLDRDLDGDLDEDLARELDELDGEREPRSAAREWLVMAGQLAAGVLGGAAVWLGFNWMWGALPQAALVVALAVIAGMVFIVRKIRKAEDLQTTVYAVLVGLLATVSPAALLLLNR
ncbi:hypothetical protein [Actinophytocola sediminis]